MIHFHENDRATIWRHQIPVRIWVWLCVQVGVPVNESNRIIYLMRDSDTYRNLEAFMEGYNEGENAAKHPRTV